MASSFGCPWGDAHLAVVDALSWLDNSRLKCVSRAFHDATLHSTTVNAQVWWGQAQSTEQDIEGLVPSLVGQRKVLTPQTRPNLAMLMIDSAVLLTTTVRDLCGRLHSAHLVPLECPILVMKSNEGVFGAGVTGEGAFSTYEDRDIELDPVAPVTVVLTVGYIPPEGGSDGGAPEPRVRCFVVDDLPQYRRQGLRETAVDGVTAVLMECAPSGSGRIRWGRSTPAVDRLNVSSTEAAFPSGTSSSAASDIRPGERAGAVGGAHSKGPQQPLRRSTRASTVAHSKAASQRAPPPELTSPSSSIPLEDADTVFLVGNQALLLERTTAWLQKLLGEEAVILGGISTCALVVGDQVFPGDKARRTSRPGISVQPLVAGVALRGVHAMAVSAKGFEGVGPIFRVDATVDTQAQLLTDVTVVSEGGAAVRTSTAMSILENEVLQDPAWGNHAFDHTDMFLEVGASPAELRHSRSAMGGQDQDQESEDAGGTPPIRVMPAYGATIGVLGDVSPSQYARFLRTSPQLVLADTELAYQSCKRRIEREGSVVLSSIQFTCFLRPDFVELSGQQEQQHGGEGGDGDAMVPRVMALHQQEMVRFIKTQNAPAAGVFCEGELGPLPTLIGGIVPKTRRAHLQGRTSCAAVLCWNPGSIGT